MEKQNPEQLDLSDELGWKRRAAAAKLEAAKEDKPELTFVYRGLLITISGIPSREAYELVQRLEAEHLHDVGPDGDAAA